jgi:ankyrin repeat protein
MLMLLQHGADANWLQGQALHAAIIADQVQAARLLLSVGAAVTGMALDLAVKHSPKRCYNVLMGELV